MLAAHDVGRPVFLEGVAGQIEGGIAMGVGFALTEDFVPGETRGFKQYRIPRTRDMPEMVTILVGGTGDPPELEAKGVAECSNMPVAPAITVARRRHRRISADRCVRAPLAALADERPYRMTDCRVTLSPTGSRA